MINSDLEKEFQDLENGTINAEIIENAETSNDSNTIATIETNLKDVLKGAEGTLIVIEDVDATGAKLQALVDLYAPEIAELKKLDRLNPEQLKRATELRRIFREPRLAVQKVQKHNTSVLNTAKSSAKDRLEPLNKIVSPVEDEVDEIIKAEETKKADEKAEKERIEKVRIDEINRKIMDFGIETGRMVAIYKTPEQLAEFDKYVEDFEAKLEDLQEFEFEGTEQVETAKKGREEILARVEEAEKQAEEAKRLEAEKEQQNTKSAELIAKEKEIADKEAELAKLEEKRQTEAKRFAYVESLGFVFIGTKFVKDDLVILHSEVVGEKDAYVAKISEIEKTIENREAEAEAQRGRNATFHILKKQYFDLTGKEFEVFDEITDVFLENCKKEIADFNKEKAEAEAKKKADAEQQRISELKDAGAVVCEGIDLHLEDLFKSISFENLKNEECKEKTSAFFNNLKALYLNLKRDLYQD